jgi:hypothetical protein
MNLVIDNDEFEGLGRNLATLDSWLNVIKELREVL